MDTLLYWNAVAIECDRRAHTNPHPDELAARGPIGASRALAITHLAMHDAYFGVAGGQTSYLANPPVAGAGADAEAAIAGAAHTALVALYPNQKTELLAAASANVAQGSGLQAGHAFGAAVARAVLATRASDPPASDSGYVGSPAPGHHRPDPANSAQGYYGPFYGSRARCFAVQQRFGLDKPPLPGDLAYQEALEEVRGKGVAVSQMGALPAKYDARTPEETLIGLFWAYDGAKGIGTPPRLYNQIIREVVGAQGNGLSDNVRLFALLNAAMADAGILAWDEKYQHDLWRPVVGIREHDPSTGPASVGASSIDPDADPFWLPFGARPTNTSEGPFTPNFPSYPSGHATFGAAALQTVRRFFGVTSNGPDDLADGLVFVSEELNGSTHDLDGVRTRHVRTFPGGLWEMIEENGRSRVFLGVHWVFDAFAVDQSGAMDLSQNIGGVALGLRIADEIAAHGLVQAAAAGPRVL